MKNMKTYYSTILLAVTVVLSLVSCVKDELFNTPHPDKGAVIITLDWSAKSAEAEMPQDYTLRIGTEEQTVSASTNQVVALLPRGRYELTSYNSPEAITLDGNTATVNRAANESNAECIESLPGYLFSAHQVFDVIADDTMRFSVQMKQLVRLLDLELLVAEGDYSRVQSATVTLDGVASKADIVTGERSAAAKVRNALTQEGNKFTTSFRLLGTVPPQGTSLTVSLLFTNGETKQIESDITGLLSTFNDRTEPMKIIGNLSLPVKAGVTDATITDWNEVDGGNVDAN